jgi:hypothetical protein
MIEPTAVLAIIIGCVCINLVIGTVGAAPGR